MRYRFFSLLAAAIVAFGICGCGSGGTSADPLGTDSITLESAASQVDPGGTVVLTATVMDASGAAVVGRDVTFGFVTNASGATAPPNGSEVSTNADGEALITYKAGPTAGVDKIRASINNDKSADVYIIVGSGGTFTDYQIAFEQGDYLVSAGIYSILIATVTGTDASGNLAVGIPNEPVTFSFLLNGTGTGTLTDLSDSTNTGPTVIVNTSADGVAKVIFTDATGTGDAIFDASIPTGINEQLTISW